MRLNYQEFNLDDVVDDWAKRLKLKRKSEEIVSYEYYVDTVKKAIILKMYIEKKPE